MDQLEINFSSSMGKKLGNGETTKFWLDRWLGPFQLCDEYSRVFSLEVNKEATVRERERGNFEGGHWVWVWNWRGGIRGREMGELDSLVDRLGGTIPKPEGEDSAFWWLKPDDR